GGRADGAVPEGRAGAAAAGRAPRLPLPRRLRPAGAGPDLLVRTDTGRLRRPGAAPEQRPDAQRQATGEGVARVAVAGRQGVRWRRDRRPLSASTVSTADAGGAGETHVTAGGGGENGDRSPRDAGRPGLGRVDGTGVFV